MELLVSVVPPVPRTVCIEHANRMAGAKGGVGSAAYATHVLGALRRLLHLRNRPGCTSKKIVGVNLGELALDKAVCMQTAQLLAKYNVPRYFMDAVLVGGDVGDRAGHVRTTIRAGRAAWWDDEAAWPPGSNLHASGCLAKCAIGFGAKKPAAKKVSKPRITIKKAAKPRKTVKKAAKKVTEIEVVETLKNVG